MTNPALAEVLASYVPKLIQKRVAADPSPIESPLAEDLQAAVLFADISGFTHLTESLAETGPAGVEIIPNILNEYFGQLIDILDFIDGYTSQDDGSDCARHFCGYMLVAVEQDDQTNGDPRLGNQ